MLRASSLTTDTEIDLNAVMGDAEAAAVGIEYGPELMQFADAVARRDCESIKFHREQLAKSAGAEVLVDAAGVAANFQRMVRIADSTGIPLDDVEADHGEAIRETLDLTNFASAANTLSR